MRPRPGLRRKMPVASRAPHIETLHNTYVTTQTENNTYAKLQLNALRATRQGQQDSNSDHADFCFRARAPTVATDPQFLAVPARQEFTMTRWPRSSRWLGCGWPRHETGVHQDWRRPVHGGQPDRNTNGSTKKTYDVHKTNTYCILETHIHKKN